MPGSLMGNVSDSRAFRETYTKYDVVAALVRGWQLLGI